MKGGVSGARWIDRESYHITLRFIGDIRRRHGPRDRLELDTVAAKPFTLRLKGDRRLRRQQAAFALCRRRRKPRIAPAAGDPGAHLPDARPAARAAEIHAACDAGPLQGGDASTASIASSPRIASMPAASSRCRASCSFRHGPPAAAGPYAVEEAYALQMAL